MSACRNDIRLAILNDVNKFFAENRNTISRINDDTFQINGKLDNPSSKVVSKEGANKQAFAIAQNSIQRVDKEYNGHVKGYINNKSPYDPITVTFIPSDAYIEYEFNRYTQPKDEMLQKESMPSSKMSSKTLKAVNEFLTRNGIDVKKLDEKYKGVNAVSLGNIIQLAEGKQDVALTEEAAHFAVEMIEQSNPQLFNQMLNKIGTYQLYQQTFNEYAKTYTTEDGRPDVRKIKKEAIGKVLAEYIGLKEDGYLEKAENIARVQNWWTSILDWIRNMLKIASFNPFEEAAKEFETLEGEANISTPFFQLSDIQKKQTDDIRETENKVRKKVIAAKGNNQDADNEDTNYYEAAQADGGWKRVLHRVTDRALEFKQKLFGKKKFSEDEQKKNNILRNNGVNGHTDMENIVNRYIDRATGQKKATPDPRPITSQIMPNNKKLEAYNQLDKYVRDLINSFPNDTVFMPETIIYDGQYKGGEAGTVDLIAMEPDGKTHIFDWKFINNTKEDIAGWKQGAFNIQIGRYKEILRNRYGIKNFGMTRAIPIMMDMKPYRTLNSSTWKLNGIAVGSANPKDIEEIKFLPVPTEDERTGNEIIDKQLDKLQALSAKIGKKKATNEDEKDIKRYILDALRTAVRSLQTQENVGPMVDSAENIYIPSATLTLDGFTEFMKRDIKEPSNKEISDMSTEIDDAIRIASVYESMGIDFDELIEEKEDKEKVAAISTRIVKMRQKLEKARKELTNKYIGERNEIPDVFKPETVIKGLGKIFSSSSQIPLRTVQTLVKLYRTAVFTAQNKSLDFSKRIQTITSPIKDKKAIYNLIFKKDNEGRKVHELVSEFDPEFTKQLHSKSGTALVDFLKENINYDEYIKAATAKLQEILDAIVEGPNAENYRQAQIAKFNPLNPDFQAKNTLIYDFINRDKWESREYKILKQNAQALELYRMARELGAKAAELGYIDYMEQFRFLPYFRKGLIDKLFTGGHISPIQDTIDGLATSGSVYGEVDPLSGEKRYSIPKYGATDSSSEKTDVKGNIYRDYSEISDDIGRILVAFSMELNRYEALNNIVGQVEALRHIEEFKGHVRTNKLGVPVRDEKDAAIIDAGNDENLGVFEAIEQYLIYGNRYPLTTADADTGLGKGLNGLKRLLNRASNKISGKNLFPEGEEAAPSSLIKGIEALNRFTQMKILGLSVLPSIANFAGLHIQMASQAGRFYPFKDWLASEKDVLSLKFASRDAKELMAQLYNAFLPLVEDPNRHIWKKVGMNKIEGNSFQDFLFIGFQKPEFLAQAATFVSLLKNSIVREGKIVPIMDVVQAQYPDYQEYLKNKDARIAELKKESIWNTKKLIDGKLEIPGFDMENLDERQKLGLQSRTISKGISGNMSEEDVSRASMDIFFKSMMVFKNWIPKLVETRFGKLKKANEYYDRNSYDIGKVRLFWHVFMEHAQLRLSAIRNIIKANDKGMLELDKLYTHYKTEYEKNHNEEFTMSPARFNDMVRRNLNNQVRELKILFSMLAVFMLIGFIEPPEDKRQKAIFNTTKRGIDQIINELSFFYLPSNWENMLSQGVFPSVSTLTDVTKFLSNLSSQITGVDFKRSTEGTDEVREAAQPIKYLFKMVPAVRQGINYMTLFSPDMAKEMDINIPPDQTY